MKIRIALIGTGGIALANHLPGFRLLPQAELVALCDANPAVLQRASQETGINKTFTDYHQLLEDDDLDAVVIATPNKVHREITLAAVAAGKHVLCEKPLGMNFAETREMYEAAEQAKVRHMTAFTYRFVPAMQYMKHLVESGAIGEPYHFRVNRFQDWGNRFLAWRQLMDQAGSGELGDMLSHRIDYAHFLIGKLSRLVARTRRFLDERVDAQGQPHKADAEDWVAILADFQNGTTGLFESSKIATGRGEGGQSQDYCEINGSAGTLIYYLNRPLELQAGKLGGKGLETIPVSEEFWKLTGSPRDPHEGDPLQTFRYDQDFEFVDAILNQRPCRPSFYDGMLAQAVMDAALLSDREGRWIELNY
jgi:predicted dehydrogenase